MKIVYRCIILHNNIIIITIYNPQYIFAYINAYVPNVLQLNKISGYSINENQRDLNQLLETHNVPQDTNSPINLLKVFDLIYSQCFQVCLTTRISQASTNKCVSIREALVAQTVKRLPTVWEAQDGSLNQEDPLEKEITTHSSILAWKIPWMEEPGSLRSMGSQRVTKDMTERLQFHFSSV